MPTPPLAELAELCLAHLVREEATLRANREGLGQLHAAFLSGTFPEIQATVQHCQRLADDTVTAPNAYSRLRSQPMIQAMSSPSVA